MTWLFFGIAAFLPCRAAEVVDEDHAYGPPTRTALAALERADTLVAAGFPAAADHFARAALRELRATDASSRLRALHHLEANAVRTGDWSTLDDVFPTLTPPPETCDCDALALHAAMVVRRTYQRGDARAWLDLIPATSPLRPEADLLRIQLDAPKGAALAPHGDLGQPSPAPTLASLTTPALRRRAPDVWLQASILEARQRCVPATWTEARAALAHLPTRGAAGLDVRVARAWCAADADRPEALPALLRPLTRADAWIPSLPVLQALAADDVPAALETARLELGHTRALLDGLAHAIVRGADWRLVTRPVPGIPAALTAEIAHGSAVAGLEGRFAALEHEEARCLDPEVLATISAEREALTERAPSVIARLLRAEAVELAWLDEGVAARLWTPTPVPPGAAGLDALAAQGAGLLRSFLAASPGPPAEVAAGVRMRLAVFEAGRVPAATTIDTLREVTRAATRQTGDARWTLALTLLDADRTAEAAVPLREIAASPEDPRREIAHAVLGEIHFAQGDFAGAEQAYAAAEGAKERSLALYATYRRAWCAWALGRPKAASAGLAAVIADAETPAALRDHALAEQSRLTTCRPELTCAE